MSEVCVSMPHSMAYPRPTVVATLDKGRATNKKYDIEKFDLSLH